MNYLLEHRGSQHIHYVKVKTIGNFTYRSPVSSRCVNAAVNATLVKTSLTLNEILNEGYSIIMESESNITTHLIIKMHPEILL